MTLSALRARLDGIELDSANGRVAQYSYDASNYRVPPMAVAFPRTVGEVRRLLSACHELGIPVTPRGGGTSMAGNAVGPGIIVDLSRYLNQVVAIDPVARTAVVEPGVVLDDLRDAAAQHGLTFGPDPSSHSRCTLGGMIGNDACGNHSVRYGRTVEHVVSMRVILADGTEVVAERGGLQAADSADNARVSELETRLRDLTRRNLAEIRTELGRIPRQVSGYQLQHLLPENGFDVARALVGTEGTCALVVEATVRLVPRFTASVLVVLGYEDVVAAARDVPSIVELGPTAVEGMDEAIVETMRYRRGPGSVAGLPTGSAWLYVEFEGDDHAELLATAKRLIDRVHAQDSRLIEDSVERGSLWRVRENGAGLAARLIGGQASWPGWEDAAVAPKNLAAYLSDFRDLLARFSLTGVLYGHFGAGCVHVRIDFDMQSPEGVETMRGFLRGAAELVVRHGGTLSGEHGDGRARSELLAIMYSERMLAAFSAFKHVFDPAGLLNPGVIVAPAPITADLALAAPPRQLPTVFTFTDGFTGAAQRCIGVGRCRSDSGGFMCPSYRATHDERDSTRGRARVLQEMLNGGTIGDGWRSAEVRDALDLCLSCKACSADCPADVDMATYKAEFLHHHYKGRLRPRSHYSLGWLPLWAALAGRAARPVNALLRSRIGPLLARTGGITTDRTIPQFASRRDVWRELRTVDPRAVYFVDTFTGAFRPHLAGAVQRVLTQAGLPVTPRAGLCCGLTWITTGQLGIARRVLKRTVKALSSGAHSDLPIVVAEPSCAAALRTDLPELLGTKEAADVAARVHTFAGALTQLTPDWQPPELTDVVRQTHCHEYATFPGQQPGSAREASGCCGLAGNFGFETEHYQTSMDVAELSLRPLLTANPAHTVLADGFSCQTQISHLTDRRALHLAEYLDRRMP